ncbi:MAG: methionine biosynthesis protein MetW [Desulfobulbaceae bacterium]|nr:methionine biosynthesis protein MetW [Desulfobulbaceae bacterium]
MRFDLQIIAEWIEPGAKVLDLGCGEGNLLYYLNEEKGIVGTGIESREDKVAQCIASGLSVLQGDLNAEVVDYPDQAFDYVILSQTLQQVYEPDTLILELLRIGKQVIVSFPNFAHWRNRLQLLLAGKAPVSKQLPFEWYNTPNIRVVTIRDFYKFSQKMRINIRKGAAINSDHHDDTGNIVTLFPNLRASYGIFLISSNDV